MEKNDNGKVIRPPVKSITNGTIFKPSKAYLHKMQFQNVLTFIIIWLIVFVCFIAAAYIAGADSVNPSAVQILKDYIVPVNLWTVIINLFWLVPALILTPLHFKSIEYSVKAETGDTMPEIYQKEASHPTRNTDPSER